MANTSQNEKNEKTNEALSLEDILVAFNNPVNEEQAWAVCFQCAQYFQNLETHSLDCRVKYHELYKYGKRALKFFKDGAVFIEYLEISRGSGKGPPGKLKRKNSVTGKDIKIVTENDAIQALGLVIYQALDYGLGDNEERHLGRDLEHLLELMINPDEEDETFNADDEGIEKDAKEGSTFQEIKVLCVRHLTTQQDAGYHYKAVCRALAAEAAELLMFLDKVSIGSERLVETQLDKDLQRLDDLQRADWARLWVGMMRELRQGVRLKKVEHIHTVPPVSEFELTPFEILLEDIRTRRYTLNKIMVNGDIPNTVKCDAHAVMLDFIRSRPPLQPAKDRVLKSPPKRELTVREQILLNIRSHPPKLKSIKDNHHIVETSRTKLDNDNDQENPQPVKKVIKPDFNLLLDSFEDDEDDDSSGTLSPKSRRCSVATPSPEKEIPHWRRTVVKDAVTQERNNFLKRRNTITVCESPQVSPPDEASEHETKLKRNTNVSKSNACPSDLRKRLNDKLHGRSSLSQLHNHRLHGSISEHPSESELTSNKRVTEQGKSESHVIRRTTSSVSRVARNTSMEHSTESTGVKRSSYRLVSKAELNSSTQNGEGHVRVQRKLSDNTDPSHSENRIRVRRKISDVGHRSIKSADSTNSNSNIQRTVSNHDQSSFTQTTDRYERLKQRLSSVKQSLSTGDHGRNRTNSDHVINKGDHEHRLHSDSADKSVKRRSSHRVRRQVSTSSDSDTTMETESSRPHSPKIMVPNRSGSPVSQLTSSPLSPTHLSTTFAGLIELSSSPIKMHASPSKQVHDNACTNGSEENEVSLGRSLPSRRILVTRRSSMPVSKSCNDLEGESPPSESLHRTQSVLNVQPEKPKPKPRPRLSKQNSVREVNKNITADQLDSVPKTKEKPVEETTPSLPKPVPRPRTKLVQRSQSQLTSNRLSLDLSQLRAMNQAEDQENSQKEEVTQRRNFRSKTPGPSLRECESPTSPRLSELSVNELLNVSVNTGSVQTTDTNRSSAPPCQDSSSSDSKWNHPIECLSLTLEEVMHIRTVLTKAELESLINQPEFYSMVSKGKVCFTCKEVKFSILGQWGNRCKICKRNVCNNCLRKMNIPTEHFHNIPVHTLSPIPLGQEALDILKVYESTGSVPHSPLSQKKLLQEIENKTPKTKGLQRSQTFNSSPNLSTPLPNKNLLKGPQMNVCSECKKMIMDIIRTSRTSIALINQRKPVRSPESSQEEKRPSSLSASSLSLSVKNFFTQN